MSQCRTAGAGRAVLYERGFAEWMCWFSRVGCAERFEEAGYLGKYGLHEAADEMVVLLANIIQEAIY
jgi:hypothetical protein